MHQNDSTQFPRNRTPQVKICGLTRAEEAVACVELGASAIGCVFYPKSPRFVTEDQAQRIRRALPSRACSLVGVFVDEPLAAILGKVKRCGLDAVQLHGREPPQLVERLEREGIPVIKALFQNGDPSPDMASAYNASAFLVECAGGPLPGGNAMAWSWGAAATLSNRYPLVLAGGLNPDNVLDAVRAASPDAVDVSSGVEAAAGRKDMDKVKRFLEAVLRCSGIKPVRRIFK